MTVVAAVGTKATHGRLDCFLGNDPKQCRANVPGLCSRANHDLYPSVDAILYGNGHQLEYDLVLNPGADPGQIRLRFDGVYSKGAGRRVCASP